MEESFSLAVNGMSELIEKWETLYFPSTQQAVFHAGESCQRSFAGISQRFLGFARNDDTGKTYFPSHGNSRPQALSLKVRRC